MEPSTAGAGTESTPPRPPTMQRMRVFWGVLLVANLGWTGRRGRLLAWSALSADFLALAGFLLATASVRPRARRLAMGAAWVALTLGLAAIAADIITTIRA